MIFVKVKPWRCNLDWGCRELRVAIPSFRSTDLGDHSKSENRVDLTWVCTFLCNTLSWQNLTFRESGSHRYPGRTDPNGESFLEGSHRCPTGPTKVRITIHFKRHLNHQARCRSFLYQPCNQHDTWIFVIVNRWCDFLKSDEFWWAKPEVLKRHFRFIGQCEIRNSFNPSFGIWRTWPWS